MAPRAVSVEPASRRSSTSRYASSSRYLSGIHWRGPLVVTAAEALAGSDEARVIWDGGEVRAPVVACDLATDVAVLRVEAGGPSGADHAHNSGEATLLPGAGVIIVGRGGVGPLVAFGTVRVAGPAWASRRGGAIARRLEFEANLDARFEGALVADLAGLPCAMLVPGPRGSLLGIPAATIERIVAAVEQHGYLPRPYLGLRLQALWLDEATRTRWGRATRTVAAVAGVEPQSPAEASGLVPGDLVEAIDGTAIDGVEAFAAHLAQTSPGRLLALRLRRGGQPQTVEIQVGEWRQPAR